MTVSYAAGVQNARMDAVVAAIDGNALAAKIEVCSAGYAAVLCSVTLSKPSFIRSGVPPSVLITMLNPPKTGTATASGIAAVARIKDGAGTVIVNGLTVGTTAADIIVNSTSVTALQPVTISSGTITHSP